MSDPDIRHKRDRERERVEREKTRDERDPSAPKSWSQKARDAGFKRRPPLKPSWRLDDE